MATIDGAHEIEMVINHFADETTRASTRWSSTSSRQPRNRPARDRQRAKVPRRFNTAVVELYKKAIRPMTNAVVINLFKKTIPKATLRAMLNSNRTRTSRLHRRRGDRAIALKDKSRSFPVGQPLGVLKWRYADKDEAVVPLSINCWPTPNNDGTCDVNIEYELEASQLTLRDLTISIPLPTGSYPTVAGDAQWSLNVHTHALDWRVPLVDGDSPSGSLEFSVAGHDPS
ncbi:hypothetical protein AURDEDRAFT_178297, partial [Auricularia subglabra TFB-10046 SS5]